MNRAQIIHKIKINNELFFSRGNKRFFGDQKYRFMTRDAMLHIDCVYWVDGKCYTRIASYTWDKNFKLMAVI